MSLLIWRLYESLYLIKFPQVTSDLVRIWRDRANLVVRDEYYITKLVKKTFSSVGIASWIERQKVTKNRGKENISGSPNPRWIHQSYCSTSAKITATWNQTRFFPFGHSIVPSVCTFYILTLNVIYKHQPPNGSVNCDLVAFWLLFLYY